MSTPNPIISDVDNTSVNGVTATITQVLTDVQTNRTSLAAQIETQTQQVTIGQAQLAKFDALIAALQVVLADEAAVMAIITQAGANAAVSPTSAAPAPVAAPAATPASVAPATH